MTILIEGPDLVGKSALVDSLVGLLARRGIECETKHATQDNCHASPSDYREDWYQPRCIQDRGHMSELVYGYVTRDGSNLSQADYRICDGHLLSFGGIVVVVTAAEVVYDKLIEKAIVSGRVEPFSFEQLRSVNRMYRAIVAGSPPPRWVKWKHKPIVDVHFGITEVGGYPSSNDELLNTIANLYMDLQV